ncbi:hypothetical protein FQA39_LY02163 [Lamprigera yunnana]|nr:hypothetical protein FQA39_LY02163 [Lamprigera yunnana]
MLLLRTFLLIKPERIRFFIKCFSPKKRYLSKNLIFKLHNPKLRQNSLCRTCTRTLHRNYSEDHNHEFLNDIDDVDHLYEYNSIIQSQFVKNIIFPNSTDPLIHKLNSCKSMQEVFDVIEEKWGEMGHGHITQAVLVLWDLYKVFLFTQHLQFVHESHPTLQDYVHRLNNHPSFRKLIELAKEKHDEFDANSIGAFLLYINKMGTTLDHEFANFFLQVPKLLYPSISLSALSRIITAVRVEPNISSLFTILNAVPIILNKLENCETLEDLKLITICLNHLHQLISDDAIKLYINKLKERLHDSLPGHDTFKAYLRFISFLNHPKWSNRCMNLSSEIILRMKNNLHLLDMYELFIVFESFLKNHEPGDMITEIQRCASKIFVKFEEAPFEIKLKLLSCIICFSSPMNRSDYEKMILKFLHEPLSLPSLYDLLKILIFIKPSHVLCKLYWDNVVNFLKRKDVELDIGVLLQLGSKYMNFNNDLCYRHKEFECYIMGRLKDEYKKGILFLFPSKFAVAAGFILAYGEQGELLDFVANEIVEHWGQFSHLDCFHISKGLQHLSKINLTPKQFEMIQDALNKFVIENALINDALKNNLLIKSCIYRNKVDKKLINKLYKHFKIEEGVSSTSLRNIAFSLQTTNTLLPEVVQSLCDYALSYRNYLIGFNAERLVYLCYHLGYYPNNYNKVFEVIADIIIRDRERMTGLSYIQAALSLCFFHTLPNSFIQHIFNVNFLEKLDTELSNCYFKDTYPIRVRHQMMQLNRAVCLDYPEANVPWFHQKYLESIKKPDAKFFSEFNRISNYLLQIVGDSQFLLKNVITAYGYRIDYVIELDGNGKCIIPNSRKVGSKVAILVLNESCYTEIEVQLKGQQQLKKRHLELLGYKVVIVNPHKWKLIFYGEDKLTYLRDLIFGNNVSNAYSVAQR